MTSLSSVNAIDEFENSAKIFEYEGREYTEIPIDAGSPSAACAAHGWHHG